MSSPIAPVAALVILTVFMIVSLTTLSSQTVTSPVSVAAVTQSLHTNG